MIPKNIEQKHVIQAIEEIARSGVPYHRASVKYHLIYEGKPYPPKYVISIANKYANGNELGPSEFNGGAETNGFLRALGFAIDESTRENNYWLDIFTASTWKEFRDAGAYTSGFPERRQNTVNKVQPGDIFLCYVTALSRWVGALEVVGPSDDDRPIWSSETYSARLEVKPLILLNPEDGVPLEALEGQVSFFEGPSDRPAYKGFLRSSPKLFTAREDGEAILELIENGFTRPKRYWVEKTLVKGKADRTSGDYALGKALWSPQTRSDGRDIYAAMRDVQPGDVILHLTDNEGFSGVSVAASSADASFTGLEGTDWAGRGGYLIRLKDFAPLDEPLKREEFLDDHIIFGQLVDILDAHKGRGLFYNREHNLNQGAYLTEAPEELVSVLNGLYRKKTGRDLPHIKPRHSWIFQANPKRWDLIASLQRGGDAEWSVNQKREVMHIGDVIYYWQSGDDAGIYGIGKVLTTPYKREGSEFGAWAVNTQIEEFLGAHYIPRSAFLENPTLKDSAIIKQPQGTNFPLTEAEVEEITKIMSRPLFSSGVKNIIFYGPPGTGKTFKAINRALEIIHGDPSYCLTRERPDLIKEFNQLREAGRVEFVTFHQAYSYEEFVEGIRPVLDKDNIMYELNEGVFKRIATKARDNAGSYVLIIDEINRGNIPKIFGELITLIEEDKREGADSEIRTTLPYSKEEFSVPANLHIIGTMNSVDRSIALMDVALRRRFTFEEFMPEYEETRLNESEVDSLNLGSLLLAINERIEIILDRDHQIGHSFFVKVNNSVDRKKILFDTWYRELIPLFQEYFYNDYEKLEQLLGKYKDKDGIESGFVEKKRKDEIERIIGSAEGAFLDTYVGSIHHYDNPDALINALKRYVA